MKGIINFLTALVFFAAGIVLIVFHAEVDLVKWVVIFLGWVFIIPGALNIIISAFTRRGSKLPEDAHGRRHAYVWGLVLSVFGLCLGIAMLVANVFFQGFIIYLFACLLIATGVYHFLAVSYLARPYVLPWYFYIIPMLLMLAGLVILFSKSLLDATKVVVLITGIGFICSAVNSLLEYIGTHPSRSAHEVTGTLDEGDNRNEDTHIDNPGE